jgi:DNA (cytosine-5)-methyltransferase 1
MRVLDLFSGIGGFSLGLQRAGMQTVAFCEIDPFCRRVLEKRFPGVPIFEDIRELTLDKLREKRGVMPDESGRTIDIVCGGFP